MQRMSYFLMLTFASAFILVVGNANKNKKGEVKNKQMDLIEISSRKYMINEDMNQPAFCPGQRQGVYVAGEVPGWDGQLVHVAYGIVYSELFATKEAVQHDLSIGSRVLKFSSYHPDPMRYRVCQNVLLPIGIVRLTFIWTSEQRFSLGAVMEVTIFDYASHQHQNSVLARTQFTMKQQMFRVEYIQFDTPSEGMYGFCFKGRGPPKLESNGPMFTQVNLALYEHQIQNVSFFLNHLFQEPLFEGKSHIFKPFNFGWTSKSVEIGYGYIYNVLWGPTTKVCQLMSGKSYRTLQQNVYTQKLGKYVLGFQFANHQYNPGTGLQIKIGSYSTRKTSHSSGIIHTAKIVINIKQKITRFAFLGFGQGPASQGVSFTNVTLIRLINQPVALQNMPPLVSHLPLDFGTPHLYNPRLTSPQTILALKYSQHQAPKNNHKIRKWLLSHPQAQDSPGSKADISFRLSRMQLK